MPGRSDIQFAPLVNVKSLGLKPKNNTPKSMATTKPTNNFSRFFLEFVKKSKLIVPSRIGDNCFELAVPPEELRKN